MPNQTDWTRFYATFEPSDKTKQVDFVDLELVVDDTISRNDQNQDVPIYFTDIQFQPGGTLSGWVPHTQELLKGLKHTSDEFAKVPSNSIYEGSAPQVYSDMGTRWFNVMGRGHSVITIPNYYPEDWNVEILPAGVDFTIYPKEDFDLCRISTGSGVLLPPGMVGDDSERKYDSFIEANPGDQFVADTFENHPLHYRYTREFWIDGAAAGSEIKIHASTKIAQLNGQDQKIAGERYFDINGWPMFVGRKRFMLAPKGSIRFRVEFYKQVPINNPGAPYDGWLHLADAGIGFHGTAEFKQWTYANTRY